MNFKVCNACLLVSAAVQCFRAGFFLTFVFYDFFLLRRRNFFISPILISRFELAFPVIISDASVSSRLDSRILEYIAFRICIDHAK